MIAADKDAVTEAYRETGSARAVAREFQISAERVRQIVREQDPALIFYWAKRREIESVERRRERAEEEAAERLANARPCVVCGAPVLRGKELLTCTPEHSRIWKRERFKISGEQRDKHIVWQARSVLKNPLNYRRSQIRWALRVAGEALISGEWSDGEHSRGAVEAGGNSGREDRPGGRHRPAGREADAALDEGGRPRSGDDGA